MGKPKMTLCRNGFTTDNKQIKITQATTPDDVIVSREERSFRMWINSLGIETYVNNLFEDVKNGYNFIFITISYEGTLVTMVFTGM
jgi:hypothetical protein